VVRTASYLVNLFSKFSQFCKLYAMEPSKSASGSRSNSPKTNRKESPDLRNSRAVGVTQNSLSRKRPLLQRLFRCDLVQWWVAFFFVLGCALFATAAVLGLQGDKSLASVILVTNLTGASFFLLGGLMGFIESTIKLEHPTDGSVEAAVTLQERKEMKNNRRFDCWIALVTFIGTVFFEIPAITAFYLGSSTKLILQFLAVNLHTIIGVVLFSAYSLLSFKKLVDII